VLDSLTLDTLKFFSGSRGLAFKNVNCIALNKANRAELAVVAKKKIKIFKFGASLDDYELINVRIPVIKSLFCSISSFRCTNKLIVFFDL
jgi:hypothetical protein